MSKEERLTGGRLKILFSLLLLIMLIVVAYFYFVYPTAVIEIEPTVREVTGKITLLGSPDIASPDRERGLLPLREMEVEISAEQEISTTGEEIVGVSAARGKVKFINESKEVLTIPAGTLMVNTEGIKFKTLTETKVPGLEIDYLMDLPVGMRAGQSEAEIICLQKGTEGNVSIGSINKLMGNTEDIYLINTEPTRGGEDKHYQVINRDDRELLHNKLEDYLQDKLITRFYQESGGSYRIIEDELKFSNFKISYSGDIGERAERLKATGSLTARGYVLKNNELNRLVWEIFQDKLTPEEMLLGSDLDIKDVELEKAATAETGKTEGEESPQGEGLDENADRLYNIKVELLASVISSFNSSEIVDKFKGSAVVAARKELEEREDVTSVEIKTRGKKLPGLGFAIKLVVREPEVTKVFAPGD